MLIWYHYLWLWQEKQNTKLVLVMIQSEFEDLFFSTVKFNAYNGSQQKCAKIPSSFMRWRGGESGGAISLPISCFLITLSKCSKWKLTTRTLWVPSLYGSSLRIFWNPILHRYIFCIGLSIYKYISSMIHFIKNKNLNTISLRIWTHFGAPSSKLQRATG